ncbi:MAG TPA: MFS transporter [Actinomycetaceae bacterium]|nr:MFS transporter [Actinomycetaceae bacterium]
MTPSETATRPFTRPLHRRHVMVVVGAALALTASQFQFLSAGFVNPPLAESLGTGLSEVMMYNSLMAIAGVVAMTFIAPVVYAKFGVRNVMIVFGLISALSTAAVTFVTSLGFLYTLGFVLGLVFGAATMMAASMLVNTWFEAKSGSVMGAVFAFSGLGGISAGLIFPSIVSSGGWQLGFLVLAAVTLVFTVGSGLFLVRSKPSDVGLLPYGATRKAATAGVAEIDDVHVPGVPARAGLTSPQFFALILGIVLYGVVQAIQQHFAPMAAERGVTLAVAGSLLSLMALASVFTNLILGTLNDRRGAMPVLLVAMSCQVLSMLGFAFATGFLPLAVSTVVFAFAVAFPGVMTPILVIRLFGPKDFGTLLGPASAAMPAGMAIGAPLWGVVRESSGSYTPMMFVSVAITIVIALLLAWAIRSAPRLRARYEPERVSVA